MSGVEEGIERAERRLKAAYWGFKQFQDANGEDKLIGLVNAVTAGRSVTWILQKNLNDVDGFDEWYSNCQDVLKNDDICSHMVDVRNKIEKEGDEGVTDYSRVTTNSEELRRAAPSWADRIFIGDNYGGSGFIIEQPDGEDMRIYYDFPGLDIESGLFFEDLDSNNEGMFREVIDAEDDLKYYLKVMFEIVNDAKDRFGNSN